MPLLRGSKDRKVKILMTALTPINISDCDHGECASCNVLRIIYELKIIRNSKSEALFLTQAPIRCPQIHPLKARTHKYANIHFIHMLSSVDPNTIQCISGHLTLKNSGDTNSVNANVVSDGQGRNECRGTGFMQHRTYCSDGCFSFALEWNESGLLEERTAQLSILCFLWGFF